MFFYNVKAWPSLEITRLDKILKVTLLRLVPRRVRPNQLTALRLLMIPVVAALLVYGKYQTGLPLFLLAALTDLADGAMARTRNQVTDWGTLYDPIADKLLIGITAAIMMFTFLHWSIPLAIIGVELCLIGGTIFESRRLTVNIRPNIWGKWKGFFQFLGLTLLIAYALYSTPVFLKAAWYILLTAIGFGVVSLVAYKRRLMAEASNA